MSRTLKKQWFLISLAAVLALGFAFPKLFAPLAGSSLLRNGVVATVLFLMALPLETRAVLRTIRRPWAAFLGAGVNMGLVPLLAWGVSPLLADELAVGLIVAATAPCTLASAAVWTRRAGGNDAAAILVTILTNSTCFLTTPLWLSITTRTTMEMDLAEMMTKLGTLVVAPMTLGQLLRLSPQIARTATDAKRFCGTLAQCGILTMVLIGAVRCSTYLAATDWRKSLSLVDLLLMLLVAIALHLSALWIGYGLAGALRLPRGDRIAVAFSGSQKTLMVGLYVAINYFTGLAILPMIGYHVSQLFLDTLIADRWAAQDSARAPG